MSSPCSMPTLSTLDQFLNHGLQPCSPTHPVPDDYTCCICTEACLASEAVVKTAMCQNCHFHRDCLTAWITCSHQGHATCPLDRTPLFSDSTKPNTDINGVGVTMAQLGDMLFAPYSWAQEEEEEEEEQEPPIHTYTLPSGQILVFKQTRDSPCEMAAVFATHDMLKVLEHNHHTATTPSAMIRAWPVPVATEARDPVASANIVQAVLGSLEEDVGFAARSHAPPRVPAVVVADLQCRFDALRHAYLHAVRRKTGLMVAAMRARLELVRWDSSAAAYALVVARQIDDIVACMRGVGDDDCLAACVLEECEITMAVLERLDAPFSWATTRRGI